VKAGLNSRQLAVVKRLGRVNADRVDNCSNVNVFQRLEYPVKITRIVIQTRLDVKAFQLEVKLVNW
jgi:hypothetical protein